MHRKKRPGTNSAFHSVFHSGKSTRSGTVAAGFTLVELMVVILIVSLMATLGVTAYMAHLRSVKPKLARANMKELETNVELFHLNEGVLPQSLQDLRVRPPTAQYWPTGGYLKTDLKDPWGNRYVYRVPGQGESAFELLCLGADGMEGGEGENADIPLYEEAAKAPEALPRRAAAAGGS